MKFAVILSGSGVYDGSEIQESVLTLLAIAQRGYSYEIFAPDRPQHHVINHITGQEMNESRNVLIESARIARGNIRDIKEYNPAEFGALFLPGGFGAAKNLSSWAFEGPDGSVESGTANAIIKTHALGKPICALCIAPAVLAKAFQNSGIQVTLSVGTDAEPSPYDITAISEGLTKTGAKVAMVSVHEISIDHENKIITAPCYMMNADIFDVYANIQQAVHSTILLID
jgi:enhancing lycopene biosynthesis protein 2